MLTSFFKKLAVIYTVLFAVFYLSADIDAGCPAAAVSFSKSPIGYDGVSELTITFDSTAIPANVIYSGEVDLSEGIVVADPSNISTNCNMPGTELLALSGANTVTVSDAYFTAGSSCSLSLDVRGASLGSFDAGIENFQVRNMSYQILNCGSALGSVEVVTSGFSKSFKDDPVSPGQTVALEYTIVNRDRSSEAVNISFTEDLYTLIPGLVAVGLPEDACGGSLSGSSILTFSGGSLEPTESCTFEVDLQIPGGAVLGKYTSTSSNLTMDINGSAETFPPAEDFLNVNAALSVSLNILDDPQNSGDDIRLEYTITNLSATFPAIDITLQDNLTEFLGVFPLTMSFPAIGFCGAGSSANQVVFDTNVIGFSVTGATLNAAGQVGDSCTFEVTVTIPQDMMPGVFTNNIEKMTGTIDGKQYSAVAVSDDVQIFRAPQLFASFEKSVAAPGETLDLEYTLHFNENDVDSTSIAFAHDLKTGMPGVIVGALPKYGVCTSGTLELAEDKIKYSGGSLDTNTTCEFEVPVTIPEDAQWKNYDFPTSEVTANTDELGMAVDSPANSAVLLVSGLDFTLEFIDDPLFPGESGRIRYVIDNFSKTEDVSGMYFTHNLNGLNITIDAILPVNDICGSGSLLSLNYGTTLVFNGGNLLAAEQCSFDVEFTVSDSAETGVYGTATSTFTANVQGNVIYLPAGSDVLAVTDEVIEFSKKFSSDFTVAGSTIDVEYTITNTDTEALTDIAFTDDIDAALSGMVAVGLPQNDVCDSGSQIDGTNTVSFSGGTVSAGDSCTFTVTYQIPEAVSSGTEILSTTSAVTGKVDGFDATGNAASDSFTVSNVAFSKSFSAYDPYTKTATLSYNIKNLNAADSFTGITFSDDLGTVFPGAVATNLPQNDVCGAGSQLSGTSFVTMTSGSMGPSGVCSFDVDIQFADNVASADYTSTTSDLMHNGLFLAPAASADINVFPVPPVFTKMFGDDEVTIGDVTTLTFRVNNLESDLPAENLNFVDVFPAGLVPADPLNAFVTCTGGDVTVQSNGVTYSSGTAMAERICEVVVNVEAVAVGTHVNTTGELTSSIGNGGTATDNITVKEAEVPDEGPDETPDEVADETIDEMPDEVNDETTDEITDEDSDEMTDETADETSDEVNDETVDETVDETPDETTDDVMPDKEVDDEVADEIDDVSDEASDAEADDATSLGSSGCGCSLI